MEALAEGLWLVDLDQDLTGHSSFISSWVYSDADVTFVVDPGPSSSIPLLLSALEAIGVQALDFVLLTHIHLDHGGGVGDLLAAHQGALIGTLQGDVSSCPLVFCHAKGIEHLVAPDKLWQGALGTLGPVAEAYGRPLPVPAHSFTTETELDRRGIKVVPTPGHAPHHVSFLHGGTLFAGEALATRVRLPDGASYLRPATPPRFLSEVFFASLDRLASLEPEPQRVAFGHHGLGEGAREFCRRSRAQLELWVRLCQEWKGSGHGDPQGVLERLLVEDPDFGQGRFEALDPDIQARERYYVGNSLKGIWQSLEPAP